MILYKNAIIAHKKFVQNGKDLGEKGNGPIYANVTLDAGQNVVLQASNLMALNDAALIARGGGMYSFLTRKT